MNVCLKIIKIHCDFVEKAPGETIPEVILKDTVRVNIKRITAVVVD